MVAPAIRRQMLQAQRGQVLGKLYPMPAPIGGINAISAQAAMPETDALILDNLFCQPGWVECRGGKLLLGTYTGNGETAMAYQGGAVNQLFVGVNNGGVHSLVRADNAGGGACSVVAAGFPITNTLYDWVQSGTIALQTLTLVNGSDVPLLYDGTTWWPQQSYTATITAITKAAAAQVTINTVSASNPATIGDPVSFNGVVGMTQINGLIGVVQSTGGASGAWTFTVNINSSGFTAYVSGGTLNQFALTGGPAGGNGQLSLVANYKNRLWFAQKGTLNIYYLPQNVIAGALTLLPLAPVFRLGGSLQALVSISTDNTAGMNDFMGFVASTGEVVLFQGYDPASVTTWFEANHFRMGQPVSFGRRFYEKMGSDAALLTRDGVVMLSEAMLTDRDATEKERTYKIRYAVQTAMDLYGTNAGWQVKLHPQGSKLIVNVAVSPLALSYQFVQNSITGSWTTFGLLNNPWNANCFEVMGNNLYMACNGAIYQADTGLTDAGTGWTCTAQTAFSDMGEPGVLKQWTQFQPLLTVNSPIQMSVGFNVDFAPMTPTTIIGVSGGSLSPGATWNVSLWNTSFWGDNQITVKPWIGLRPASDGYQASLLFAFSSSQMLARWQRTNFMYNPGGQFYGRAA